MRKYKRIYIEITNICNLSCDFCPKTSRAPMFMDSSTFREILEQIKGHTDSINLHVMGEPLLHPELSSFLDMAGVHGYRVNITTNGTLIGNARDKLLGKPALKLINFSLHSFDANTGSISMDEYLDDIFEFISMTKECKRPLISLRLWNLEDNVRDYNKAREGIYKNRYILNMLEKEFKLDYNLEEQLSSSRSIKLSPNVVLNKASRFEWPDMGAHKVDNKGFCYGLRDQAAILADGTVVPCCLDSEGSISLGNINEETFSKIIEGKRAKSIYEGFSRREVVEDLCRKCDYRRRFDRV